MINTTLIITPIYAAFLGLMLIAITLRVGLYRKNNKILYGYEKGTLLEKLVRGQGNFTELVPLAIILICMCEINGASSLLIHCLNCLLIIARVVHYLAATSVLQTIPFRPLSMLATFCVYLISSVWLLLKLS